MEGRHWRFTKRGKKSTMVRSLRKLKQREDKEEGRGFTQWGGSSRGTRAKIESQQGVRKR